MNPKLRIVDAISRVTDACLRLGGTRLHDRVARDLYSSVPFDGPAPADLVVEILSPPPAAPAAGDRPVAERILAAYRKAKKDQSGADAVFLPSSLWQRQLDDSFAELVAAGAAGDVDRFHRFLANFGASENYTGINYSTMVREHARTRRLARRFERLTVGQMVGWWLRSEARGRGVASLSPPRHGNQAGAMVNGHFVGVDSVLNDHYGRMIAGLVNRGNPVIAEVGGGYGILAYSISRHLGTFRYFGFDLPETLCCAAWYLMKCFPDKRFLLYGEGAPGGGSLPDHDFVLMPSYEIARMPDRSADIALNMSSLGEMRPATCRRLVAEICRASNAFWHMNHEFRRNRFEDGTASLLNSEYPVPGDAFRLVLRYIEAVNALYKGRFDEGYDIYGYYYERR